MACGDFVAMYDEGRFVKVPIGPFVRKRFYSGKSLSECFADFERQYGGYGFEKKNPFNPLLAATMIRRDWLQLKRENHLPPRGEGLTLDMLLDREGGLEHEGRRDTEERMKEREEFVRATERKAIAASLEMGFQLPVITIFGWQDIRNGMIYTAIGEFIKLHPEAEYEDLRTQEFLDYLRESGFLPECGGMEYLGTFFGMTQ